MTRLAVLIDWPYDMVNTKYMMSMLASGVCSEPDVFFIQVGTPNQDVGANYAIKYALENGADEILSVCCDQMVPKGLLDRFRSHGVDCVGALTATRQAGHAWLTYQFDADLGFVQTDPTEPFQRVDSMAGCWWAKRSVFERVPMPWFFTTTDPTGSELVVTSDFNFFAKVFKALFYIVAHIILWLMK